MEETKTKMEIIENVDVEDIGWEYEKTINHFQSVGDLEENILSLLVTKARTNERIDFNRG